MSGEGDSLEKPLGVAGKEGGTEAKPVSLTSGVCDTLAEPLCVSDTSCDAEPLALAEIEGETLLDTSPESGLKARDAESVVDGQDDTDLVLVDVTQAVPVRELQADALGECDADMQRVDVTHAVPVRELQDDALGERDADEQGDTDLLPAGVSEPPAPPGMPLNVARCVPSIDSMGVAEFRDAEAVSDGRTVTI